MPEDAPHNQPVPEHLLGELEGAVMRIIWRRTEVTVRNVLEELQPARPLKYTTVMTVMSRLAQKGVLTTRKQGNTFYYRAAATPEAFVAQRAERAVQALLATFGDVALAYILRELEDADPERRKRLRDLFPAASPNELDDAR